MSIEYVERENLKKWIEDATLSNREHIMKIIRANKKEFIYAMNHINDEDVWGSFKRITGMSAHERLYFDEILKEGIEHEDWMNGDKKLSPDRQKSLDEAKGFWGKCKKITESYKKEEDFEKENKREFLYKVLGVSKPKKRKAPLHPGKVAYDILVLGHKDKICYDMDYRLNLDAKNIGVSRWFLDRFITGQEDVDHVLAYQLAKVIENTDVAFWLCAQEIYDEYMRSK